MKNMLRKAKSYRIEEMWVKFKESLLNQAKVVCKNIRENKSKKQNH